METVASMTPTARDVAADKVLEVHVFACRCDSWRDATDLRCRGLRLFIAAAIARERERAEEVVRRASGRAAAVSPSAVRICDEIAAAIRQPEGPGAQGEAGDARRAEG